MVDDVDDKHVLAVLPAFLDWWRGDEGDDTPYEICGAVLDALRSLPVEQRMAAMGMEPGGPVWDTETKRGVPCWKETRRG